MKRFSLSIILITLSLLISAQSPTPLLQNALCSSPRREVRAMWLTTVGGLDQSKTYVHTAYTKERQQEELRNLLDQYQHAGINTILLQARVRGTMIYPSAREPWNGCLLGTSGRSPEYDALAFAIDECHRRGMELHARVVTIPLGKWNELGCKTMRRKLPALVRRIDADDYMDPEKPRAADYLVTICGEITCNCDTGGIHLDYVRYPEGWPLRISRTKGRRNITRIMEAVRAKMKRLRPWVEMNCPPIDRYDDLPRRISRGWNAYAKVCQNAQGQLKTGLMDRLYPILYFKDNSFFPFTIDWKEESYRRMIIPGLGIYFISPSEHNWPINVIRQEPDVVRQYGMGYTYFRRKFLTDNTKDIYDFTENDFTRYLALVPAITWQHSAPPMPPTRLRLDSIKAALSWPGAKDRSDAPYLVCNIYASQQAPADIHDTRNIIAARIPSTSTHVPTAQGMTYAVTAMDRYGSKSEPLQTHQEPTRTTRFPPAALLPCDGLRLQLSDKGQVLDALFVLIESLQGTMVTTRVYQGRRTDVSKLPEGMYVLRSINRGDYRHHLGHFMVKRNPNL